MPVLERIDPMNALLTDIVVPSWTGCAGDAGDGATCLGADRVSRFGLMFVRQGGWLGWSWPEGLRLGWRGPLVEGLFGWLDPLGLGPVAQLVRAHA